MADECFFKFKFHCDGRQEKLTESGLNRIESIIRCSKIYLDGVGKPLENSLRENRDLWLDSRHSHVSHFACATVDFSESENAVDGGPLLLTSSTVDANDATH